MVDFFNDHVALSIRSYVLLGCNVKQIVVSGGNTNEVSRWLIAATEGRAKGSTVLNGACRQYFN
jgi:hypothetical protein